MSADLHVILGDLVSVNHRLTRVAARAARGTESPALWRTLSVLRSTGPIRLGELADLSRVSQPTATKLVGGLVARGWIERTSDPDDARVSLIAGTPAGEAALAAWRTELADLSRVSQPSATKLVGGLVARGWIERTSDAADARVSLIASTPAGEAALMAWRTELAEALLPYFADLPAADVETLERAVAILRDRVEATERMAAPHRPAAEPTVSAR